MGAKVNTLFDSIQRSMSKFVNQVLLTVILLVVLLVLYFAAPQPAQAQPAISDDVPVMMDTQEPAPVVDAVPISDDAAAVDVDPSGEEEGPSLLASSWNSVKAMWNEVMTQYEMNVKGAEVSSEYVDPLTVSGEAPSLGNAEATTSTK